MKTSEFKTNKRFVCIDIKFKLNSKVNVLVLAFILSILLIQQCYAENDNSSKIKTVYLVNIARFTDWEHVDTATINLCTYENVSIYNHLDKINNADIGHGRKLIVLVDPEDINLCNIVYWDKLTVHLRNATAMEGILEVTDSHDAFLEGMDVLLFLDNNKLRFFIAKDVLNENDIKISSKLMRLSKPPSNYSGGGILTDIFSEYAIVFNYMSWIKDSLNRLLT